MLRREQSEDFPFHHIHAVGSGGWDTVSRQLNDLGLTNQPRLDVRQYIYDMDVVMAAADVVLSRAGASTLSELTALGKPAVIVPSPYVVNTIRRRTPGCWSATAARWCSPSRSVPAMRCTTRQRPSSPPRKNVRPWPVP